MRCSCGEGKFNRTDRGFETAAVDESFRPYLTVKVGAVCEAPPVHDCAYIRVRNRFSDEAMRKAWEELRGIANDNPNKFGMVYALHSKILSQTLKEYYGTL